MCFDTISTPGTIFVLERKRHERRACQVLSFLRVIKVIIVCQRCNSDQRRHSDGLTDRKDRAVGLRAGPSARWRADGLE